MSNTEFISECHICYRNNIQTISKKMYLRCYRMSMGKVSVNMYF